MFGKNKCKRCGEKISDKFEFCPNCGARDSSKYRSFDNGDWGMLGKDDFSAPFEEIKLPAGINMIFNSLLKNLDKEFGEINKEMLMEDKIKIPAIRKSGISINISTSGNMPPRIMVRSFGDSPKFKHQEGQLKKPSRKYYLTSFSEEQSKRFSKLPRKEPKTTMKRLSNKIIYEIEMPEVKSNKNVSITKLENSIEIKGIGEDKAYFKLIPINLPIVNYNIEKGKLILELDARE